MAAASRSSPLVSNSLTTDPVFSDSGAAVRMVGRPNSVGTTASIP